MAYKRSYSDFRDYARKMKDSDLTRTQLLVSFRDQGGKVQKKKGLEILREIFAVNKGEEINTPVRKLTETKNKYNRINITKEYSVDKFSPAVQSLQNNIEKLYGQKSDSYIQVRMKVKGDGYSKKTRFSILIPNPDHKTKHGIKNLGNQIMTSIKSYYGNLAKMYSNKNKMSDRISKRIDEASKNLKDSKYTSESELFEIMGVNGFDIESIETMNITGDFIPTIPRKVQRRRNKK